MYRLRFETIEQGFDVQSEVQTVLPLDALYSYSEKNGALPKVGGGALIAEIPSVIWEGRNERIRHELSMLKEIGLRDALCENIGALGICSDIGLKIHGGMYLNILNSRAAGCYFDMGCSSLTLSFEMPFKKIRAMSLKGLTDAEMGIIIYGYLPLMKFRACPAMGKRGCSGCSKNNYLTDRRGEKFRIMCRGSEYSELLNCVPLYVADKALPKLDFYTLYFTTESREDCKRIFDEVQGGHPPDFRRTAGLYNRELL